MTYEERKDLDTMGEDNNPVVDKKQGRAMTCGKVWAAVIILILIPVLCGLAVNAYRKNSAKASVSVFAGKALEGEPFSGAIVEFIPGYDNPTGEAVCQAVTGAGGRASVELPYGEYTVKWYGGQEESGYRAVCQNVEVGEETAALKKWLFPLPEEREAYILVEWDSAADVDLCVYSGQNGRCLGIETTLEYTGGFRYGDYDGEKGYELVYLEDFRQDTYMIYTKNNLSHAKNQGKDQDGAGLTVSIYTADGLLYRKTPGGGKQARLWNCACIDNGKVEERDEHIYTLADYPWAARDKENPASWTERAVIRSEETYEYSSLDGGIKEIEEERFDREGNQTSFYSYYGSDKEPYNGFEWEYDGNGQKVAFYDYQDDGYGFLPVSKTEYVYNEEGRMIRSLFYIMEDGTESLGDMYEWDYDGNGNKTVCRFYDSDGTLSNREEYEYDMDGNELSSRSYNGEGVLWSEHKTEYDERGNVTALYNYGENHALDYKIEYQYDEEGHSVSKCIFNGNGVLDWRREFTYDESGNLLTEYSYDEEGTLTYIYEYDVFGHQTGIYDYEDGVLGWYWEQTFDETGKILTSCEYRDGKLYRKREWIYNERGGRTLYIYNGNGTLKSIDGYGHQYICDAVGGMEISYDYENGVLTKKKITVYY